MIITEWQFQYVIIMHQYKEMHNKPHLGGGGVLESGLGIYIRVQLDSCI